MNDKFKHNNRIKELAESNYFENKEKKENLGFVNHTNIDNKYNEYNKLINKSMSIEDSKSSIMDNLHLRSKINIKYL